MAEAALALERYDEATDHAAHAVRVAPEEPLVWYVTARVFLIRRRLDRAAHAVAECIRLEPRDPNAHALAGAIAIERRDWNAALAAADEGLRLSPEHDGCTNIRAGALTRLGRNDEAARTLRGQLARTPGDPTTHANQGWTALHAGDHQAALTHFREALRLDPTNNWARTGIIEALKARYWIYRQMLRWFLWMEKLSPRVQMGVILGGWLLYRGAHAIATGDGPLRIPALVFAGAYVAFVLSTWFASPISNGLLCLNRFGRLALTGWEKLGAAVVCATLALGVLAFLGVFGAAGTIPGLLLALLALPLKILFDLQEQKARGVMALFVAALVLLGATTLLRQRADPRDAGLSTLFAAYALLAFFGSQIVAVSAARWASRR